MSNINDKLIQLAETKSNIRDAIISKGVEVDTSLPFGEYAGKIDSIKAGESEFISAPFCNGQVGYLTVYSDGRVFVTGRFSYINNFHNRNDFGVFKIRFYVTSSGTNNIVHSEFCYNFAAINYKPTAYCWRTAETFTGSDTLTSGTWYYLCIRFDKVDDTTTRKRYYLSNEGFYLDDDHKIFDFEDNLSIDEWQGCIGASSFNNTSYLSNGCIDAYSVVLEDYDGNILQKLWVGYPVNAQYYVGANSSYRVNQSVAYAKDFMIKASPNVKYGGIQTYLNESNYINVGSISDVDLYFNFTGTALSTDTSSSATNTLLFITGSGMNAYIEFRNNTPTQLSTVGVFDAGGYKGAIKDQLYTNGKTNYLKLSFNSTGLEIYRSKDKGKTYELLQKNIPIRASVLNSPDMKCVFFADASNIWGMNGVLYYSTRIVKRSTGEVLWKLGKD